MMSSTPWSKAASLVRRSPRRVNASHAIQEQIAADVHVDDGQVRMPVSKHHRGLRDGLRLARDVDAVVECELDHLDDERLFDHDQNTRRIAHGHRRLSQCVLHTRALLTRLQSLKADRGSF